MEGISENSVPRMKPLNTPSQSPSHPRTLSPQDRSYNFHNDKVRRNSSVEMGGSTSHVEDGEDDSDDSDDFDFLKQKDKGSFDAEQYDLNIRSSFENEYGRLTPMRKSFVKERGTTKRHVSEGGERFPFNRSSLGDIDKDQVLRCSGNLSFQRRNNPVLMRMKTKSRLLDPPAVEKRFSHAENRSGVMRKSGDVEEEDPFRDDIPDDYRKSKISFMIVIQWFSLILIVTALVCSLVVNRFKAKTVWGMQLWKWEVVGLVLICGGLISGWLIRIIVFFIERNVFLRKRVLYFVYSLRGSVQRFLWLGWGLLAWVLILDKRIKNEKNSHVLPYVTKVLICCMVATLVWFVKTLLIKVVTMNFHVSAFFDRIQDALFNQYVIETLSGSAYLELERIKEEEDEVICEVRELQKAGYHIPADIRANCLPNEGRNLGSGRSSTGRSSVGSGMPPRSPNKPFVFRKSTRNTYSNSPSNKKEEKENSGISIEYLHRLNQVNISAWNMKRLMSIVRKGVLTTLDEQLIDSEMEDDNAIQIRSEKQAKFAAKRVFANVARPMSRRIYLEDLTRFLREDESIRTMHLFEGAGDGRGISKRALKNWVVKVFRERRALALSLTDTKTAVHKLHHLVNVLVGIAVVILWLLVLGVPLTHFFIFVSSQVVVLALFFGNTCKTTFEAIVFLFVMHPFDVGDRCEIEGVQMVVEEMNILTTVFLRYDNQKIIYPNNILATKPISNYYRSPDMGDAIDFSVHISTPIEKISLMKERITRYIENKKEHWYPEPMIVMRDVEDMNKITFSIWLSHTMNHQDMGERYARRALLVEEMVRVCKDLDIEYRMLPMDVNVRNMPGLVSDRLPSNWTTNGR